VFETYYWGKGSCSGKGKNIGEPVSMFILLNIVLWNCEYVWLLFWSGMAVLSITP
jgi:hypothetical protein